MCIPGDSKWGFPDYLIDYFIDRKIKNNKHTKEIFF